MSRIVLAALAALIITACSDPSTWTEEERARRAAIGAMGRSMTAFGGQIMATSAQRRTTYTQCYPQAGGTVLCSSW